jgi:hypothetical protein
VSSALLLESSFYLVKQFLTAKQNFAFTTTMEEQQNKNRNKGISS